MNKTRIRGIFDRLVSGGTVRSWKIVCGDDNGKHPTDGLYKAWLLVESKTYGFFVWSYKNHYNDADWENEKIYPISKKLACRIPDYDSDLVVIHASTECECGGYDDDVIGSFRDGTPDGLENLF